MVYVHGICRHEAGYSLAWWQALRPFLDDAIPDDNRLEVLWSDIVNPEALEAVPSANHVQAALELVQPRRAAAGDGDIAEQLRDVLMDRAHRQYVEASLRPAALEDKPEAAGRRAVQPSMPVAPEALINIPGIGCVNDFAQYLRDSSIRQAVIAHFTDVVAPKLKKGAELEVISHSWGTVVAYEGLRLLDTSAGLTGMVHTFFTVGSALSIGPVKRRLLPAAIDGHRPQAVQTWINLDARFDVIGGPLQGVPFAVDAEYLNLVPVGCSSWIPNPACAHGSYFNSQNDAVNRDIFARYIRG